MYVLYSEPSGHRHFVGGDSLRDYIKVQRLDSSYMKSKNFESHKYGRSRLFSGAYPIYYLRGVHLSIAVLHNVLIQTTRRFCSA